MGALKLASKVAYWDLNHYQWAPEIAKKYQKVPVTKSTFKWVIVTHAKCQQPNATDSNLETKSANNQMRFVMSTSYTYQSSQQKCL